jgi:inner membrane transporter RhtA
VTRPTWRGHTRTDWATVIAFGLSLAAMNTSFYAALARLPIGVVVTIEFVGPLLLSAAQSRRLGDLVAVAGAAIGVVLISQVMDADLGALDLVGIGLALLAGAMWAAYIVLSGRTGSRFSELDGLSIAMVVATVVVAPAAVAVGTADGLSGYADPDVLWRGAGIALLSSVLPYSLELQALRTLSTQVFGILLSLEPAVAALAGLLILHQSLSVPQLAGMLLVVLASAAVAGRRTTSGDLGPCPAQVPAP